ncbi:UNKNOWN [Stylonychia lemnae]|uniref:Uncharacterized protein n=1 Tax=Stylonychia lemnae TaxID=5949 RepID=A0A078B9G2_STYLE|nr:UNKNOWN [Stylonychia lemnae]|eukprot:CDW89887.1 UNKNOWN [Stylonychia lemnae]
MNDPNHPNYARSQRANKNDKGLEEVDDPESKNQSVYMNQSNTNLFNESQAKINKGGYNTTRSDNKGSLDESQTDLNSTMNNSENSSQKKKGLFGSILSKVGKIVGVVTSTSSQQTKVDTARSTDRPSQQESKRTASPKVVDRSNDTDDQEGDDEQEEGEEGEEDDDEDEDEEDEDQDEYGEYPDARRHSSGKIIKSKESGPRSKNKMDQDSDDDEDEDEEEKEGDDDDEDEDGEDDDENDEEEKEEDDGEGEEEDDDEEQSSEEEKDPMDECVHRLPRKGQRVHLEYFNEIIQIEKEQKNPPRRGFLKTLIWGEDPADKAERTRFMTMQEGRIIILKEGEKGVRKYGQYFATQDNDKVKMPQIGWNATIQSVRSLCNLEKVTLLNYKEVYGNDSDNDSSDEDQKAQQIIQMVLAWREETEFSNFGPPSMMVRQKLYLIEKQHLETFINRLKVELKKWRNRDVACELK